MTVTVGVDGSWNGRCALKWASDEAKREGCVLRILCAGGPSLKHGAPWTAGSTAEAGRDLLAEAQALVATRHPSVLVETELSGEPPEVALLGASSDSHLLVVGSHGGETDSDGPLGSVSDRCIQSSSCPVAVVHTDPDAHRYRSAERRIVVGVDGSPDALAALQWALTRAQDPGTTVSATIVADRERPDGGGAAVDVWAGGVLLTAKEIARREAPDRPCEVRTLDGPVAPALCRGLSPVDLLVVGARGSAPPPQEPLGSVASRCTQDARCPVVVVRAAPVRDERSGDDPVARRLSAGRDGSSEPPG